MDGWEEQEALNEVGARDRNEWVRHQSERLNGARTHVFQCECSDAACDAAIELTFGEYDAIRVYATRFAVALNHENPTSEYVVTESDGFAVVDKVNPPHRRVARATDPRR